MAEWSEDEAAAFGDALARLRDTHGVSQERLAEQLGVTRALVGQWENRQTEPPRRQVFAIEERFQLRAGSLSRLLGYLPVTARSARSVPEAVDADPRLDTRDREMLKAMYRIAASR